MLQKRKRPYIQFRLCNPEITIIIIILYNKAFELTRLVTLEHVQWQECPDLWKAAVNIQHWLTNDSSFSSLQRSAQSLSKQWLAKRGPCLLGMIAQAKALTLPTVLLASFVIAPSPDKLTTSEQVGEFDSAAGGKRRARSVFFPHCPGSQSFLCPLSHYFPPSHSSSHPHLPSPLGGPLLPQSHSNHNTKGLTDPLFSCFSLISCCQSRLFHSRKLQRDIILRTWVAIQWVCRCVCLSVQIGWVSYDNLSEDDIIESARPFLSENQELHSAT